MGSMSLKIEQGTFIGLREAIPSGLSIFIPAPTTSSGSEAFLQLLAGEQSFSNYSGVQRIILFRSGTSHKILMVTSPWYHLMLHPLGLVPRWKGLPSQFRGDWSQRMASSTSESDSNTFTCEEMQYNLSYYFFSLTTDMNCFAQNPQVPAEQSYIGYRSPDAYYPGVRVLFFFFWLSVNPFCLQSMATLKKGDQFQMWEFIPI